MVLHRITLSLDKSTKLRGGEELNCNRILKNACSTHAIKDSNKQVLLIYLNILENLNQNSQLLKSNTKGSKSYTYVMLL